MDEPAPPPSPTPAEHRCGLVSLIVTIMASVVLLVIGANWRWLPKWLLISVLARRPERSRGMSGGSGPTSLKACAKILRKSMNNFFYLLTPFAGWAGISRWTAVLNQAPLITGGTCPLAILDFLTTRRCCSDADRLEYQQWLCQYSLRCRMKVVNKVQQRRVGASG